MQTGCRLRKGTFSLRPASAWNQNSRHAQLIINTRRCCLPTADFILISNLNPAAGPWFNGSAIRPERRRIKPDVQFGLHNSCKAYKSDGLNFQGAVSMKAMVLNQIDSLAANNAPLKLTDLPEPVPGDNDVLIQVSACGVCHTELDEIEGRMPPPLLPVIPGHQVVGRVVQLGGKARRFKIGDRVGVAWIY
jgi:hypothetical protein